MVEFESIWGLAFGVPGVVSSLGCGKQTQGEELGAGVPEGFTVGICQCRSVDPLLTMYMKVFYARQNLPLVLSCFLPLDDKTRTASYVAGIDSNTYWTLQSGCCLTAACIRRNQAKALHWHVPKVADVWTV